jgi:hypothetical protein
MSTIRIAMLAAAALVVVSGTAVAGKAVFERADLGIRFDWSGGSAIKVTESASDVILDGTRGAVTFRTVVRKGERVPEPQHHFRLVSYFAGEWQKAEEDCRGAGWDACAAWTWISEPGDREGLGMVGYGPGGTYVVVMHAPIGSFKTHRPAIRRVQESLQLF